MNSKQPFKWKHFQGEIILLCVRWYLKYALSYRNLEEIMMERGIKGDVLGQKDFINSLFGIAV